MSNSSSDPRDPKGPKDNSRKSETPSFAELPSWLKTDDWSQDSSPSSEEPVEELPTEASQYPQIPPSRPDPTTDLIEIVEDSGMHPMPSDDSLFVNDDIQIISSPPSGVITSDSGVLLPPEPSEMISLPPVAKAERELQANKLSEDDVDISALFAEEESRGGPSSILRRTQLQDADDVPTLEPPVSAWFPKADDSSRPTSADSSDEADIDIPPAGGEGASDIFSTARERGSPIPGSSNNSALYTGAESNVFVEDRDLNRMAGGESHILGDTKGEEFEGGSSQHDDPGKATDRVTFDLPPARRGANPSRIGSSAGDLIVIPDDPAATDNRTLNENLGKGDNFDFTSDEEVGNSGSNLFGERLPTPFDSSGDRSGSGVNLSDPESGESFEAGPLSSIFNIPRSATESADEGRVNIDHIPAMGSSDENTEAMMQFDEEGGPSSSVFSGDESSEGPLAGDSGMIEWSHPEPTDEATYRSEYQQSMRMQTSDSDVQLPGLDEVSSANVSMPASGTSSGSIFGSPSTGRGRAIPKLPGVDSEPGLSLPSSSLLTNVTVTPNKSGRLLVGALGLVVGAGLGVGGMAMVGGGGKAPVSPPASSATAVGQSDPAPRTAPSASGGVASARALLSSGDVNAALEAFEAAGDGNDAKVGRGQARWMVRVRKAAVEGQKLKEGDEELTRAAGELQAVMNAMATEAGASEQQLGARAALHLGLIREVSGKPDEAFQLYGEASRKFPAFKKWFDSARQRITVMKKNADGSPVQEFSQAPAFQPALSATDADRLASLAVVLLDFDPVQQSEDEAGYHFWEAIQRSANWNEGRKAFTDAIAAIDRAKKAHDDRRRKLVGMGLNPVSDPREQMFLRACDELRFYWLFKSQIYGDPTGIALARSNKGTQAILTDLLAAKKNYDSLAPKLTEAEAAITAAKKAATELEELRTSSKADLAAAQKLADEKADDAKKALAELNKRDEALKAARTLAQSSAEIATKSKSELADAQNKLKLAESALDAVITRMKAAKLIDDKASRAEAIAALPDAARKAAIVSSSSKESEELTKQLAEAQKKLGEAEKQLSTAEENARLAKVDLEKQLKAVMAAAEKKTLDLEAKLKASEGQVTAEVKKAVEQTRVELDKQLAEAKKSLEKERAELEAKVEEARLTAQATRKALEEEKTQTAARLAAQAEQYRMQLASVRSGATVQLLEADQIAMDRAAKGYAEGVSAYFQGNYSDGARILNAAVSDDPTDARIWYFLGLCKLATGQSEAAVLDFRKGGDLEARGKPGRTAVGIALERVQGAARQTLDAYRP